MNILDFEINDISMLALQTMQSVLAKNQETERFAEDGSGPLALASALSDFFEIASVLENGEQSVDAEQIAEFGEYGLDLLDRLAYQTRQLEIMDQRDNLARIYASLAVWLARRDAILDNLEGTADGFAMLTNGLSEPHELAEICLLMGEVIDAASEAQQADADRSNPWRPWRILNLNAGIAATRSLDPQLMEQTFEQMGRRLPHDMPGFLADGKRQMATQDIPDPVREVMDRFTDKWPDKPPH